MAFVVAGAQAGGVRVIAICAALVACGRPEASAPRATPAARDAAPTGRAPVAPGAPPAGARLTGDVVPVRYELTLEVDPAQDTFTGHVAITIAVATPGTRRIWLHAAELALARATLTTGAGVEPVAILDGGAQLRGFALPRAVGPGEPVTLAIDYAGRVSDLSGRSGKDEEGLFRQRAGGRWYLYSQSESTFARKIVPCFDEPRFKPAWRVTLIVPRGQLALGNAPVLASHDRPDGRRQVELAELAALPSYLLAIAVGPFELVDAGKLGRGHLPVRLAVLHGDGGKTAAARRVLPRLVDALERYLDAPLPLAKLDLVAVPDFFGAMENTGLVTFETAVLVGGRDLTSIAAHELAHQWFGNAVTPAWWEHLWLSEAFATWLGERVTDELGAARPPALAHRARGQALAADDAIDAEPLVHPVATADDIEPAFDAIAYDKGAAVLAMFERFVGPAAFQVAVRGYVAAHAGRVVTSHAFLDALASASRAEVAAALATNLAHAGAPVVELAVRCDAAGAAIVASVRDGVTLPLCVRAPPATRRCFLAGAHTEQGLPGCPAWLVGNEGGRGYYRVAWRGAVTAAPFAALSPDERLARGDDLAAAVQHGELAIGGALAELTTLARSGDPYGELAALAIARAIDPLVADPVRPAWTAWLAGRFAHRLTRAALGAPRSLSDAMLRVEVVELAGDAVDRATLAAARAAVLRNLDAGLERTQLRLAAAHDASALFDRLVELTGLAPSDGPRGDRAADQLEALGAFPAAFAPRVVDVLLDRPRAAARVWPGLAAMLARSATAAAAWRAIHARLDPVLAALSLDQTRDLIATSAALCDAGARAELAAAFTPRLAAPSLAPLVPALATTLATIDRCLARRAALGDLAAALAGGRAASPRRR